MRGLGWVALTALGSGCDRGNSADSGCSTREATVTVELSAEDLAPYLADGALQWIECDQVLCRGQVPDGEWDESSLNVLSCRHSGAAASGLEAVTCVVEGHTICE